MPKTIASTSPVVLNACTSVSRVSALSGGPINITSGGFIYSPTANVTGTVTAGLNFGAAEGVIQNTNALGISGVIAGSGGLTAGSPSSAALTLTGANSYTGTTTLVSGAVVYAGPVANDGVTTGAFGLSTSAIVMNPGTAAVLMEANAATTFARNLSVVGSGPGLAYFGTTGNFVLTMSGNININTGRTLVMFGGSTAASAMVVNGAISGGGGITDSAGSFTTLNGNNTFTGGTNIATGTYNAGSDTAFGTGTIFVSGTSGTAGTITGVGTSGTRTIPNDFFLSATETFGGAVALNMTGGINLNGARTVAVSNTAGTAFSGVVSNGALTKTNVNGALSLNSPTGNTYTGGTVLGANVNALIVNNTTGSGTGSGTVSIGATSATTFSALAGNFTISGATSIAGRLSPGNSGLTAATAGVGAIGAASFGSTLTLSSATSSLFLEFGSATAADKILVAGQLTLTSGMTVNLATAGYTLQGGEVYDLLDWGTLSATTVTFSTTGVSLAPGVTLDTSRFLIDGTVTAVPEPTTFVLSALGAAAMAGCVVRRRRILAA